MFWGRNLSIRWLRVQGLFKLYLYGVRGWVRKAGDFCCPLLLHHQSLLPCVDVSVLERHRTTSAVNTPLFNARHGLQCASVPAVMCRKKKHLLISTVINVSFLGKRKKQLGEVNRWKRHVCRKRHLSYRFRCSASTCLWVMRFWRAFWCLSAARVSSCSFFRARASRFGSCTQVHTFQTR